VRISAGCVAPIPIRCPLAEGAVEGKQVNESLSDFADQQALAVQKLRGLQRDLHAGHRLHFAQTVAERDRLREAKIKFPCASIAGDQIALCASIESRVGLEDGLIDAPACGFGPKRCGGETTIVREGLPDGVLQREWLGRESGGRGKSEERAGDYEQAE